MTEAPVRLRIRVEGTVQGVGYRPFVFGLAAEHQVAGFVGNDAEGVFVEAEACGAGLAAFVADLQSRAPMLARVERVTSAAVRPTGERGFRIVESIAGAGRATLVAADTAPCARCLAELRDPSDRRHRYPFINCTDCGPRFTIVTDVPYDRATTTMAGFVMCPDCAREYGDPADRRFHAEPICCPACGPRLRLLDAGGRPVGGDAVTTAGRWLRQGLVLAIKGLGGYHLAALAGCESAVAALRARKHREEKPFAVMASDVDSARRLVEVDAAAQRLLCAPARPIVLLPRRPDAPVADRVAPGNRDLGVMLPYTPLHHLLATEVAEPFVLTSGNASDEPIAYVDGEARQRLRGIADAFLVHDRRIHTRTDDSVVRVFRGRELPVRRSRGYAPAPVTLPWRFPRPVLACGAELKSTFCLGRHRHAFVSQHIGDLKNYETLQAFTDGIAQACRLFDIRPEVVAHDLHPQYLSTAHALARVAAGRDVELVGVQHHHAHIASCLADNGEAGPVIGVAFDGSGYGGDGTVWGGEVLVADLAGFERAGHLDAVPMPGGDTAVRQPWRMAASYVDALYGDGAPELSVIHRHRNDWAQVVCLARTGTNAPLTTSAGRLFDAVAAITGVRDVVSYEGQAAIELEQRVDADERGGYPVPSPDTPLLGVGPALVGCVIEDVRSGVEVGRIAARFHYGLATAVVDAVSSVAARTGLTTAALSGGVFQNVVLLERVVTGLEAAGLRVLVHSRVPPNDGGISLGQAAVAGARDRAG